MDKNFEDLIEIMQNESKVYRELKSIEEKKNKVIMENDVKALDAITKKEQGFVKTIVHLEELRAEVIDGFCKFRGIKTFYTIDDMFKVLGENEVRRLKKERDKLYNVTMELKEVNELNNLLIRQNLEYINYTIEVARGLTEEDAGYDKNMSDRTVKVDKSLFDVKV